MPGPIRIPVASLQACIFAVHPNARNQDCRVNLEAGMQIKARHSLGNGLRSKSITSSEVSTYLRPGSSRLGSLTFAEAPFSAISRFNWSPESAEMRPLLQSTRTPARVQQLMRKNQTLYLISSG